MRASRCECVFSDAHGLARVLDRRQRSLGSTWLAAVPIAGGKCGAGLDLLREGSNAAHEKMTPLCTTCGEQSVEFFQRANAAKNSARQGGVAPVGSQP